MKPDGNTAAGATGHKWDSMRIMVVILWILLFLMIVAYFAKIDVNSMKQAGQYIHNHPVTSGSER